MLLLSSIVLLLASYTAEEGFRESGGILFSAQACTDNFTTEHADLQPGEQVGAYIMERIEVGAETSLKPTGNIFDNLFSSYQSKGILEPQSKTYYPSNTSYVDFYVYASYGVVTEIDPNRLLLLFVQQDQSSSDSVRESDLLQSKKLNVSTTFVSIPSPTFSHCLSKLIINPKAGIGVTSDNTAARIAGTRIGAKLNMIDGMLTKVQGDVVEITPTVHAGKFEYEAIITSQTVTEGTKPFNIISNGRTYYRTVKDSKEFDPGTKHAYDITINVDDLRVEMTGTINEWDIGETTIKTINQ